MSKIQTNKIQHTANGAAEFTLPTADGTNGQVLKTNGSGTLSFGADQGGKIVQVKSVSKLDTFAVTSPTANQYYDVTGLDNLQITTTGSNKVIVFMSVYMGLQASGYTGYMRGIRTTSGSVTNLSYPSSSDASNEASAATVAGSNTSTNKVTHPLHIVGFEDSPGAGTHTYGIQIATRNTLAIYTGRPYNGTNSSNLVVTPSGTITLWEVEA